MKTLIKPLFVAFALVLSTSYASLAKPTNDPQSATFQSGIFTNKAGKLQVALDKQAGHALQISLVSTDGHAVYAQRVGKKQTAIRLLLDVNDLPDGSYQLIITDGKDVAHHTITLATKKPVDVSRMVAIN